MSISLRLKNAASTSLPREMKSKNRFRSLYHLVMFNLLYRRSLNRRVTIRWGAFELTIEPPVLHPDIFKSGTIFAELLQTIDLAKKKVLDMGTGSGILALVAATRGAIVAASDNDPVAVRCATHNVRQNGLNGRINVIESNLFDSLTDRDYDIVLFNPPYLTHQGGTPYDSALYGGPDLSVIKTFAESAVTYLKPNGFVLLMTSSDSDVEMVRNTFRKHGYSEELLERKSTLFEDFLLFKFAPRARQEENDIFVCPSCHGALTHSQDVWRCETESLFFKTEEGIPDFVLPGRREAIDRFLHIYKTVRRSEGWGSHDAEYYNQIPFRDTTGRHHRIWRIRAKTFEVFLRDLGSGPGRQLRILDLGAGNCWLSKRLADKGHSVVAVDICTDSLDGLGVSRRLGLDNHPRFECTRAEFDHLPFPESYFDIVIFNASLHYAGDPHTTLLNILQFMKQDGAVYVLDSPVYIDERSGQTMMNERVKDIRKRFGLEIPLEFSGSFLTYDRLRELGKSASVLLLKRSYGLSWTLQRVISRLYGRETASFDIVRLQMSESR